MKKNLLTVILGLIFLPNVNAKMIEATAISTPSGWGQRITEVEIKYDRVIQDAKASDYRITDRTILSVESNKNSIILHLDPNDFNSGVTYQPSSHALSVERKIDYKIQQIHDIGKNKISSIGTKVIKHKVVDDFKQFVFIDEATGIKVPYNLYIPKNYNPEKSYPLVMFIHDAGATNSNIRNTLFQGNGATEWAKPENQNKEEVFVLAPQFDHFITNDQSDDPVDLDPTVNLIRFLTKKYNIDQKRLYATGQSGGAMMSIAMNIKYPNLFAATWIVAGQWDPQKTAPIAKNNLFILVSENDTKAFPTENKIIKILAENGAIVKESKGWNGQAAISELNNNVDHLLAEGGNVNYATFKGGSLALEQKSSNLGGAHMGTWKVAYNIDHIRDWLLNQRKQ